MLWSLSSAKVINLIRTKTTDFLCFIFNTSITTDIFSEEWKSSKVVPVFKQGDRIDLDNNRPTSVIPVVAKVFDVHLTLAGNSADSIDQL